jgi:hypothetical protein
VLRIDLGKPLYIDRDQSRRRAVALGLADRALELPVKLAFVGEAGKRIDICGSLGLAEPRARLGQRSTQKRILVDQPGQGLPDLGGELLGGQPADNVRICRHTSRASFGSLRPHRLTTAEAAALPKLEARVKGWRFAGLDRDPISPIESPFRLPLFSAFSGPSGGACPT